MNSEIKFALWFLTILAAAVAGAVKGCEIQETAARDKHKDQIEADLKLRFRAIDAGLEERQRLGEPGTYWAKPEVNK